MKLGDLATYLYLVFSWTLYGGRNEWSYVNTGGDGSFDICKGIRLGTSVGWPDMA